MFVELICGGLACLSEKMESDMGHVSIEQETNAEWTEQKTNMVVYSFIKQNIFALHTVEYWSLPGCLFKVLF